MKIPYISIHYDCVLFQTQKAILFEIDDKRVWIPKKLCSDLNDEKIPVLALNQALSQGFALPRVNYIIYYTTTFDMIMRKQSEDRGASNPAHPIHIIDIFALNTIDERIMDVLNFKISIIHAFKEELKHAS